MADWLGGDRGGLGNLRSPPQHMDVSAFFPSFHLQRTHFKVVDPHPSARPLLCFFLTPTSLLCECSSDSSALGSQEPNTQGTSALPITMRKAREGLRWSGVLSSGSRRTSQKSDLKESLVPLIALEPWYERRAIAVM